MKKLILTLAIGIFFIAFSNAQTTSIKKAEKTEYEVNKKANAGYQCPMDCEKGKVYKEKGKCPKCGMELKAVTKLTAKSCSGKKEKGCCSGKKAKTSCADKKAKTSCADKKKKSSCSGKKAKSSCADKKKKSSCSGKKAKTSCADKKKK